MEQENKYALFLHDIARFIPGDRIYTDELRSLAWGTDAGFYRLISLTDKNLLQTLLP